jgi:subtilisin
VVFRPGIPQAQAISLLQQSGAKIIQELHLINAVAVEFPSSGFQAAELGLKSNENVVRVDKDSKRKWIESAPATIEGVELPSIQSIIQPFSARPAKAALPWGITRVNAPAAWSVTKGAGVKVAVIDTGIDYTHPTLKRNIKGGHNAVDAQKADDFMDDNGHGTHVSGTIAGVGDAKGVTGVAPAVDLYGVKVLDAQGSGTVAGVIAGIQWAADNHMDVANMSLGSDESDQSLADAVAAAAKAGLTIIAAAGNSGGPVGYPGAYPECIAVSASDKDDKIASFSSFGPQVAVIAPGVDVFSTYMGGGYKTLSGTSMATPHVTGLAALAVAAKGVRGSDAIRAALKAAASPLPGLSPEQQGAGLVDAKKLVR